MTAATLIELAPYVFGPGNAVSALLVAHQRRSGWVVLIAVQLAYVAFGLLTGYWGFTMNLVMAGVGGYNLWLWRRRAATASREKGDDCAEERA